MDTMLMQGILMADAEGNWEVHPPENDEECYALSCDGKLPLIVWRLDGPLYMEDVQEALNLLEAKRNAEKEV